MPGHTDDTCERGQAESPSWEDETGRPAATERAINEATEICLIPWPQLDWPLDWDTHFGRRAPLAVEIGFGNGAFLEDFARNHRETNCVGLEISWNSISRLFRRIVQSRLNNVRVLHADARFAVDILFPPQDIREIYINFPDPWPKERHHERCLIQPEFVRLLSERLVPGGQVVIATDHAKYASWIARVLQGQDALRPVHGSVAVHEMPGRFQTRYERRGIGEGSSIHYFVWENRRTSPASLQIHRVGDMPNVLLLDEQKRERLMPVSGPRACRESCEGVDLIIKFMHVFQQVDSGNELVEVMVKEGNLSQHFGVLLTKLGDGRVQVKLAAMAHPRPTLGVKRAIWHLARHLIELNPHLKVLSCTVGRLDSGAEAG